MIITGTVVGDAEVVARFERIGPKLDRELQIGVGRAVLMVQRHSKQSKLSGQVLKVQTGRLRRSINTRVASAGDAVEGTVGTNVAYARIHEFGWRGSVTVREHLRQTKSGFASTVRAHSRQVDMPERSFLRSALRDMAPAVKQELAAAATRAIAP